MMLLLVLLLAIAQDRPAAKTAMPAELRFAWPENVQATVESQRTKEQREGATVKSKSIVRTRYRMHVMPRAKGGLIRFSEHALMEPKLAGAPAKDVAQALATLTPSIVVDAEGTFEGIEDVETLRRYIDALVAPLKKQTPGAELDELSRVLTSDLVKCRPRGQPRWRDRT